MKRDFFASIRLFRLNSVLVKTFVAIVGLFLAVVVLFNVIMGQIMAANYREQTTMTNLNVLSQAGESMETAMTFLANDMHMLMWYPEVIRVMVAPNQRSYTKNYAIASYFSQIQTNDLIDAVYLYLPNAGLVYTADTSDPVHTYLSGDTRADAVIDTFRFSIREFQLFHTNKNAETGLYCRDGKIYLAQQFSLARVVGVLFYEINEQALFSAIQGDQRFAQGQILVYDQEGIAAFGEVTAYPALTLDQLEYYGSAAGQGERGGYYAVQSDLVGWWFLYPVTNAGGMGGLWGVLGALIPISLVCMAVCLLLALYATYAMFKPVNTLLKSIVPPNEGAVGTARNEYEFFHQQYDKMLEKNQALEGQLESVAPEVTQQLLWQLVQGTEINEAEIEQTLASVGGLIRPGDRFVELLVQLSVPATPTLQPVELGLMMRSLTNVVASIQVAEGRCLPVKNGDRQLFLVFAFPSEVSVSRMKNSVMLFRKALDGALKNLPYQVVIGRSDPHSSLVDLPHAYRMALQELKESAYEQDGGEPQGRSVYRRRVDRIAEVAAQNRDSALNMADLLCQEIGERMPTLQQALYGYEMVIDSMLERLIALRIPVQEPFLSRARPQAGQMDSVEVLAAHTLWVCECAIDYIHTASKKSQPKYIEVARRYIEENFANSDLDLGKVSEHVGINQSYLSKLFKEVEGQSFVEYLNAYRVEQARRLLTVTGMSVKEVGFMCGFNSPQNFIRVFKKFTGKTPGQMRGG